MALPNQLLDLAAKVTPRPFRVSSEERPIWRVAVILLTIPFARGKSASRPQLHVLYWAARSERNAVQLADFIVGKCLSLYVSFSADPSTDIAIALAGSSRLIRRNPQHHRLELTEAGEQFRNAIIENGALMPERDRMALLPTKLTIGHADSLWRGK